MTAARLWMLATLIIALLAASLMLAGARLGWHMGGHTAVLPKSVAAQAPAEAAAPPREIDAIVALAPFGQEETAPQPQQTTGNVANLNVVLRGVLVDPDPGQSRAFVLASGKTSVLHIGDEIQMAELVAINTDTITLQTGDQLQIVGFDGIRKDQNTDQDSGGPENATANDPFARLAAAIVSGPGSIDLRDAPPPETTDDYIKLWRDKITRNPKAAMDSVGVELVENGYRIKDNPDIGVTLAGLRPGDVVTRLNGQTVGDLSRDRQLYDQVAASGVARLEVQRNGQPLLMTFPLR